MRRDSGLCIEGQAEVYRPSADSYLLLEAINVRPGERFLEVGTGSGLIAIHAAAVTDAVATDVNAHAVRLAKENAGVPAELAVVGHGGSRSRDDSCSSFPSSGSSNPFQTAGGTAILSGRSAKAYDR